MSVDQSTVNQKKVSPVVARLKAVQEALGINSSAVAEGLGVNRSFVSRLFSANKHQIGRDKLEKFSQTFGVNLEWLVSGNGDMLLPTVNVGQQTGPSESFGDYQKSAIQIAPPATKYPLDEDVLLDSLKNAIGTNNIPAVHLISLELLRIRAAKKP